VVCVSDAQKIQHARFLPGKYRLKAHALHFLNSAINCVPGDFRCVPSASVFSVHSPLVTSLSPRMSAYFAPSLSACRGFAKFLFERAQFDAESGVCAEFSRRGRPWHGQFHPSGDVNVAASCDRVLGRFPAGTKSTVLPNGEAGCLSWEGRREVRRDHRSARHRTRNPASPAPARHLECSAHVVVEARARAASFRDISGHANRASFTRGVVLRAPCKDDRRCAAALRCMACSLRVSIQHAQRICVNALWLSGRDCLSPSATPSEAAQRIWPALAAANRIHTELDTLQLQLSKKVITISTTRHRWLAHRCPSTSAPI